MLYLVKSKEYKRYILLLIAVCATSLLISKNSNAAVTLSKAEKIKATASKENQYTFIMFWKNKDKATSAMWKNLKNGLEGQSDQATYTQVRVNDTTEASIVKKYGVSRAPMPLTLAIAPNGAITGSFVKRLDAGSVGKSFVSSGKSQCMLALQSRKLVLLNVLPVTMTGTAKGVDEFKKVPCYQENAKVITLSLQDPGEASFIKELNIPSDSLVRNVVFMAPPGVLVGKYNGNVTKEKLIADLKKTGSGCGVEGCKHCK